MYAKLKFTAQTPITGKIRDIVRLINASYTGTADLNNLEFIDVVSSELVSTVNSGWQLVGGTLPSSGTPLSTSDSNYYLEGTCVDTNKKKHVSIHANFAFTSSTVTTNYSDIGILVSSVIDYGTATEVFTEGYSLTNTVSAREFGVGQSVTSEIVHIFATPRKLIVIGYGYSSLSQPAFMGHLEFSENKMTLQHNLAPIAKINCVPKSTSQSGATNGFLRGDAFYNGPISSHYYFPKSIYDSVAILGLWRVVGFTSLAGRYDEIHFSRGTLENGTTTGITGLSTYPDIRLRMSMGKFGHSFYNPACAFGSYFGIETAYANVGKELDSSGNLRIPAIPLACNIVTMGTGLIDFSQCDVYKTVGNLGVYGDELTVNGGNYFYFTLPGCPGALIIKKE